MRAIPGTRQVEREDTEMIRTRIATARAATLSAAVAGLSIVTTGCSLPDALLDGLFGGISDSVAGVISGIVLGLLSLG